MGLNFMKHILTFLITLLATAGLRAANPAFTAFKGTNQVVISSNVSSGNIIIGPATPISTTASNAAKSLMVWTNDAGEAIRPLSNAPVRIYRTVFVGTNAYAVISESGYGSTNGVAIGSDATKGDPDPELNMVHKGLASYGFGNATIAFTTNRIYQRLEYENDDIGMLDTLEFSAGTNSVFGYFGPWIQGRAHLTGNAQYFRLIPFKSNPYVFKSAPLGESNLLSVMNSVTNAFLVDYSGNAWHQGNISFTPRTVVGAGNGNTNYTLLTDGYKSFLGSSNVNIVAAMQTIAGQVRNCSVSITNLSADTWGISFSSVTNRWRFHGLQGGGTNAPTVLTNNTELVLNIEFFGTNGTVEYKYIRPAL